ncbi:hypothetical protein DFP72DRAFT_896004 [Ephemerocybe angulata]|uniref:Uncharacterized protein n=1 Tax=Ephemerocybe angulata TaxID=980116 RepID=A0A8H6M822_9AGAR|nr:hypothetical protein DFP72DRAFT_896004 [Tulosesus angulatus]
MPLQLARYVRLSRPRPNARPLAVRLACLDLSTSRQASRPSTPSTLTSLNFPAQRSRSTTPRSLLRSDTSTPSRIHPALQHQSQDPCHPSPYRPGLTPPTNSQSPTPSSLRRHFRIDLPFPIAHLSPFASPSLPFTCPLPPLKFPPIITTSF